jgi:protein-disulfide isomerase
MKSKLPFVIIILGLLVTIVGAMYVLRSSRETAGTQTANAGNAGRAVSSSSSTSSTTSPAPSSSTPTGTPAPGAEPAHVRGDESAPVLIEEYGDFQCPPCGALYPVMKKVEGEMGTRVKVIFRNYPLMKIHKNALDAARAAEAAGLQGKFWEMHDMLYEKQGEWSVMPDARPVFEEFARTLKLDVDRFRADLDGLPVNSRIRSDITRADSIGVKGTPTVFINGKELEPADMTVEGVRKAVSDAAPKGKS